MNDIEWEIIRLLLHYVLELFRAGANQDERRKVLLGLAEDLKKELDRIKFG